MGAVVPPSAATVLKHWLIDWLLKLFHCLFFQSWWPLMVFNRADPWRWTSWSSMRMTTRPPSLRCPTVWRSSLICYLERPSCRWGHRTVTHISKAEKSSLRLWGAIYESFIHIAEYLLRARNVIWSVKWSRHNVCFINNWGFWSNYWMWFNSAWNVNIFFFW